MQLTPLKHVSETELSMAPFYKAWLQEPTKFQGAYDPPIRHSTKKGRAPLYIYNTRKFLNSPTNPREFPLVMSEAFVTLCGGRN